MNNINSTRENMRQVLALNTKLGSNLRHFLVNADIERTSERHYKYQTQDIRLLRFANEAMGTVSDCFILYAVSKLGVCDKESICRFLKAIHKSTPELQIANPNDADGMKKRLFALFKNGFLFKISYNVETLDPNTKQMTEDTIQLYTIDKDSQMFMNQKLGKKVPANAWIQAKPMSELIGWAAASYVGTVLAGDGNFVEFKKGIFSARSLGTVIVPCELKMGSDEDNYKHVICIPSFLWHDKRIASVEEYEDNCLYKINTILNYMTFKKNAEKDPRAVVVVEDIDDLNAFADLIVKSEVLRPYLADIYFTGEGIMKNGGLDNAMLQLKITADGKPDFIAAYPDFLQGK